MPDTPTLDVPGTVLSGWRLTPQGGREPRGSCQLTWEGPKEGTALSPGTGMVDEATPAARPREGKTLPSAPHFPAWPCLRLCPPLKGHLLREASPPPSGMAPMTRSRGPSALQQNFPGITHHFLLRGQQTGLISGWWSPAWVRGVRQPKGLSYSTSTGSYARGRRARPIGHPACFALCWVLSMVNVNPLGTANSWPVREQWLHPPHRACSWWLLLTTPYTSLSRCFLAIGTTTRLSGFFSGDCRGGAARAGDKPGHQQPQEGRRGQERRARPASGRNPRHSHGKQHPGDAWCPRGPAQPHPTSQHSFSVCHAPHVSVLTVACPWQVKQGPERSVKPE